MAIPATIEHEDLPGFLLVILRSFVRRMKPGTVIGLRAAMKLSEEGALEPDLMFISKTKLPLARGTAVLGAADLIVEIISPSSRRNLTFVVILKNFKRLL